MSNFAVIQNNFVINTIVADTKEVAEELTSSICVEFESHVQPGDAYDPETGLFSEPVVEEIIAEPAALEAPAEETPAE